MLVFVIPLKSSQVSKSWLRVCQLFERCIKSVCNQTTDNFKVIVVCNEKPQIAFSHPNLIYLPVNFPPPKEENPVAWGDTDKGRKILAGLVHAAQFSPSHTMTVDADDCVSNNIAALVSKFPQHNGWFINSGYRYQEGSQFIRYKFSNFYRECGSCCIVRYDLNNLPLNPEYNRGYGYYKNYLDHAKIPCKLAEQNHSLEPLPFPGAVYILNNGENIFGSSDRFSQGIVGLVNTRLLTKKIRDQFGLYSLS